MHCKYSIQFVAEHVKINIIVHVLVLGFDTHDQLSYAIRWSLCHQVEYPIVGVFVVVSEFCGFFRLSFKLFPCDRWPHFSV